MNKAGLFQHFGSKEDLQLATVAGAREIFIDRAMRPLREFGARLVARAAGRP